VKVSAVPHFEGLTVNDFLGHARNNPLLLKHLPEERDWHHIDKKWVCDVLFPLDTGEVQKMIDRARQHRLEHLEQSKKLVIEMKPEFAEALKKTISFSRKPDPC
jgi:hypothetical protein